MSVPGLSEERRTRLWKLWADIKREMPVHFDSCGGDRIFHWLEKNDVRALCGVDMLTIEEAGTLYAEQEKQLREFLARCPREAVELQKSLDYAVGEEFRAFAVAGRVGAIRRLREPLNDG